MPPRDAIGVNEIKASVVEKNPQSHCDSEDFFV